MSRFEYKVIPGPRKAEKTKGLKTPEDRFAHALTSLMNELGREGWEYQRSDTLPCDERVGLTGSKTTFQTVLVFRRALPVSAAAEAVPEAALAPLPLVQPIIPTLRVGAAEAPLGAAPSLGAAGAGGGGAGPAIPGAAKTDHAAE